jgi:branched-chain amino acid transport system permease protein
MKAALVPAVAAVVAFAAVALGIGAILAALAGVVTAAVLTLWFTRAWTAAGPALVGVLLVVAPFQWSAFELSQVLVLCVGALGLVLLSGQTGQISVAQGPFVGAGAYASAVLTVKLGVPSLLTLPVSMLAGALFGLIVGIPSARLRGVYQVITTLAVGVAFPALIVVIGDPVGGSTGLPTSNPFDFTVAFGRGQSLDPNRLMYAVCALAVLLTWFVLARLIRSRHGTAMRALRQNEVVAAINGVRVGRYQVVAFVVSASFAGLAGGLYALTVGAVSPESFGLALSIEFLVAIAVGGSQRLAGGIVGAIAVFLITTKIKGIDVPHSSVVISNSVIYGLVVIVVLLAFDGGVWGAVPTLGERIRRVASTTGPAPTRTGS